MNFRSRSLEFTGGQGPHWKHTEYRLYDVAVPIYINLLPYPRATNKQNEDNILYSHCDMNNTILCKVGNPSQ